MITDAGFKTAWRACTNDTAVRHLDVDAPLVSRGLYEQARPDSAPELTLSVLTGRLAPMR